MKKKLLLLLFVICTLATWAQTFSAVAPTGQTLYFKITSDWYKEVEVACPASGWSMSGSTKPTGDLTIPSSVTYQGDTYSVTGIGDYAFSGCEGLTSVIIPHSVSIIKAGAFTNCSALIHIFIPNSVTDIRENAFSGCSNLIHIFIPSSVTTIEPFAFENISTVYYQGAAADSPWGALQVITSTYTEGALTYESPYKTMVLKCSPEAVGSITIPNSVFYIENEAFSGCEFITALTIPPSVTYIGKNAFERCINVSIMYYQAKNLSSTEDWYDEIYDDHPYGFRQMNLQMLVIGDSVETIPANVFYGKYGLFDSITIPNSVKTIGNYAFANCGNLTSLSIPNSVTTIGDYAFSGCDSLKMVTIGESVTQIGDHTFEGCTHVDTMYYNAINLQNTDYWSRTNCGFKPMQFDTLVIGNKVQSLSAEVFSEQHNLTSVIIPNSVKTIGNGAFSGCSNLSHVSFGDSVTTIGYSSFADCNFTDITFPNSLTSIQYRAFLSCDNLTRVTFPNSLTSIGDYAFHLCINLRSVTFGNSLTSIGKGAFLSCDNLETLTIPSSVTTIGDNAFFDGVKTVLYCGTAEGSPWGALRAGCFYTEGDFVFADSAKTTLIGYIGAGGRVTIPNSVTTIADSAFLGCTSLTAVTIPNSVTTVGDRAFSRCTGLKMVSIGEAVTQIGNFSFEGCANVDTMYYNAINLMNTSGFQNEGYGFRPMQLDTLVIGSKVQTLPYCIFMYQSRLTSVTFPNSVISINGGAFSSCSNLSNVSFGDSVTTIGSTAFNGCNLSNIVIPNSVKSIGIHAFDGCENLCSVTLPNSLTSIEPYAFANCGNLDNVTIPSSVTTIGDNAFSGGVKTVLYCGTAEGFPWGAQRVYGAFRDSLYYQDCDMTIVSGFVEGLTNADILDGVTTIAKNAFLNCTTLTSVTIPESVTTIKGYAFNGCTGLTTLTIPSSVTSIERYAFAGCANVTTLYYNATGLVTNDSWGNNTDYGFQQMPIQSVVIGDNVETLPNSVFCRLGSLTSVTIPSSVTTIGQQAFKLCTSLADVTLPESLTTIGNQAFYQCTTLTTLIIPSSVTTIGTSAFSYCSGLTDVNIPPRVTTISNGAFSNCTSLAGIDIPPTVTSIGDNAFRSFHNLDSVTIPNTVTAIGNAAFMDCRALTHVTIPNAVNTIEDNTFNGCSSLTSVTLPNSVTTIDIYAFQNCTSLTDINIPTTVTSIKTGAFSGCTSLASFVVRKSMTIESGAFSGCTSLRTVYNLTNTRFYIGNTYMGSVAEHALRLLDSIGDYETRGFTNHGTGSNALHQINSNKYTVVDEEDGVWNHIPRSTIPANFIYYDASNAKSSNEWKANAIFLTDGQDEFKSPVDFTADTASYTRKYTQDNRSTLCLPFKPANVASTGNLKFYAFSAFDGSTLSFSEVSIDDFQANTPYMVEWPATKTQADFVFSASNVSVPATNATTSIDSRTVTQDNGKFVGTMKRTCMNSTNYYGYKNGFFVQSAGGTAETAHAHVNPFRAYFEITSASSLQPLPPTLNVVFGNGDNLGIIDPLPSTPHNTSIRYSNDVFDLMGRRVRSNASSLDGLPSGIYIWRGKKLLHYNN